MSSGQTPRNPRYFPRMKVRGTRRKRLAVFQRAAGAFDGLNIVARDAVANFSNFVAVLNKKENK